MSKSHYVPQLVLKKFGDKLSIFNVQTQEFRENIQTAKVFMEKDFYDEQTEEFLNRKVETQFGNFLASRILKAEKEISLKREELFLIKKFLLVSTIRSMGSEALMQKEKYFYDTLENIIGEPYERPFEEKVVENESEFDYWMRTINVILDTNGTPEEILKHPLKTYPAYRWSEVINAGYVAFWDSNYDEEEFVITDVGMTSENEKGWNGVTVHNLKKTACLMNVLLTEQHEGIRQEFFKFANFTKNFHENFQMFSISAKRMIVLIAPFFKLRQGYKKYYHFPTLAELTCIPNEKLFLPNVVKYVKPQAGAYFTYDEEDRYIYSIKKLTTDETIYCNELFLDRIYANVGFSCLDKVVNSFINYRADTQNGVYARVDYSALYDIIDREYEEV